MEESASSPDIEAQREFYNQKWQGFDYAGRLSLARCVAILDAIYQLGLNKPSIIDIGCGTGWLTAILGQFGPAVGVELSDKAVEIARTRYPHVTFYSGNAFDLDLPANSFDVAVSQEVIEHVEDPKAFIEMKWRLLKKGGYIILTTPNGIVRKNADEVVIRQWTNQPIENWLTIEEMRALLVPKFADIRIRTIIPTHLATKGVYRLFNNPWLKKVVYKLRAGRYYDATILGLGYGLHQVVVARKL